MTTQRLTDHTPAVIMQPRTHKRPLIHHTTKTSDFWCPSSVGKETIALMTEEESSITPKTPSWIDQRNTRNQDQDQIRNKNKLDPKDTGYPSHHKRNTHLSLSLTIYIPPPPHTHTQKKSE
jgi:hypothetical protein